MHNAQTNSPERCIYNYSCKSHSRSSDQHETSMHPGLGAKTEGSTAESGGGVPGDAAATPSPPARGSGEAL